jgi:hypothetical protein
MILDVFGLDAGDSVGALSFVPVTIRSSTGLVLPSLFVPVMARQFRSAPIASPAQDRLGPFNHHYSAVCVVPFTK